MSLRPRNRQSSGTGGIVRLGNSLVNPVLSEFVDNGSPGFPNDSFITVENRLSQPLNVSSSLFGASADYGSYYTVPPLTRSTIPIDPERGVLISCDNNLQIFDRDTSALVTRTFDKRTVPYRLHSDGAAPSEPIYPLERCLNASNDIIVNAGGTFYQFVGGAWPGASNNRLAQGEDDICMVAATFYIYNQGIVAGANILELAQYFDVSNPSQKLSHVLCSAATPVGSRITVALAGPVAIALAVASAGTISVSCSFWVGVPGA